MVKGQEVCNLLSNSLGNNNRNNNNDIDGNKSDRANIAKIKTINEFRYKISNGSLYYFCNSSVSFNLPQIKSSFQKSYSRERF